MDQVTLQAYYALALLYQSISLALANWAPVAAEFYRTASHNLLYILSLYGWPQ